MKKEVRIALYIVSIAVSYTHLDVYKRQITYYAKDAVGNVSRKQVTVYLVDTTSQQVEDKEKTFRFISEKYLDTITQDSIWRREENYRQLEEALQRNTALEAVSYTHLHAVRY